MSVCFVLARQQLSSKSYLGDDALFFVGLASYDIVGRANQREEGSSFQARFIASSTRFNIHRFIDGRMIIRVSASNATTTLFQYARRILARSRFQTSERSRLQVQCCQAMRVRSDQSKLLLCAPHVPAALSGNTVIVPSWFRRTTAFGDDVSPSEGSGAAGKCFWRPRIRELLASYHRSAWRGGIFR